MLRILFIISPLLLLLIAQSDRYRSNNGDCEPNLGDSCVLTEECLFFAELLATAPIPRPRHVIKLLRDHHCGFEGFQPKVCCFSKSKVQVTTELPNVTHHKNIHLLPLDICGVVTNDFRIMGAFKTVPLEFPWMALIALNESNVIDFGCGGTIISERYVLTAAHCVANTSLLAGVRLGEHDVDTKLDCNRITKICAPPIQDIPIENVTVHPNYISETQKNDIALIRLAKKANFSNANVQPICLPIGTNAQMNLERKFLIICGWGVTEKGFKSAELLKASVPVISNKKCSQIYEKDTMINDTQICAGGFLGRDSCAGDSGGPLKYIGKVNGTNRYIQYGIVSYGPRYCGLDGRPGIYTRVTSYISWILDNLRPD